MWETLYLRMFWKWGGDMGGGGLSRAPQTRHSNSMRQSNVNSSRARSIFSTPLHQVKLETERNEWRSNDERLSENKHLVLVVCSTCPIKLFRQALAAVLATQTTNHSALRFTLGLLFTINIPAKSQQWTITGHRICQKKPSSWKTWLCTLHSFDVRTSLRDQCRDPLR